MWRRCVLLFVVVGCARTGKPTVDWWHGDVPPSYSLEPRFPDIEHKRFNYVAYTHQIESKGLDVSEVEAKLDSIFQKYAAAADYRKTKRGRAILYQIDYHVPDFDIWVIAEKDGETYVPSDFGYVWLTMRE